jgi:hypothetical protein
MIVFSLFLIMSFFFSSKCNLERPKGREFTSLERILRRTDRKEAVFISLFFFIQNVFFLEWEKKKEPHHSFIHSSSRGNDEEEQYRGRRRRKRKL